MAPHWPQTSQYIAETQNIAKDRNSCVFLWMETHTRFYFIKKNEVIWWFLHLSVMWWGIHTHGTMRHLTHVESRSHQHPPLSLCFSPSEQTWRHWNVHFQVSTEWVSSSERAAFKLWQQRPGPWFRGFLLGFASCLPKEIIPKSPKLLEEERRRWVSISAELWPQVPLLRMESGQGNRPMGLARERSSYPSPRRGLLSDPSELWLVRVVTTGTRRGGKMKQLSRWVTRVNALKVNPTKGWKTTRTLFLINNWDLSSECEPVVKLF